jgi:hypothetical protein
MNRRAVMRVGKKYKVLPGATILLLANMAVSQTLCPDGSYVGGTECSMAPDGSYVGETGDQE